MNAPLTAEQQEHAYLARLGERVRAWRAEHGMSRKSLSAACGVSERYLAQLEAGQGNISVLLLRKVARAMGVAVERLVREEDTVEKPSAVIATGGSLVTDPGTYELLLERCRCIWLKTTAQEHMARVLAQGDTRPFKGRSAALDEIRKLLADRERLYGRAGAAVDTSGKSVRQALAELKKAV